MYSELSVLNSPKEKISHRRTPKDQTSLCVVYTRSKMVSGAIHFSGSRACNNDTYVYFAVQESTSQRRNSISSGHSHLPCGHSLGLCRHLWRGQSRRFLLHCSLTAECFELPDLCGYTAHKNRHRDFVHKQHSLPFRSLYCYMHPQISRSF